MHFLTYYFIWSTFSRQALSIYMDSQASVPNHLTIDAEFDFESTSGLSGPDGCASLRGWLNVFWWKFCIGEGELDIQSCRAIFGRGADIDPEYFM